MINLRERGHFTPDSEILASLRAGKASALAAVEAAGDDDHIHYKDVVKAVTPVGDCPHAYDAALDAAIASAKDELQPANDWLWTGNLKKWVFRANGYID